MDSKIIRTRKQLAAFYNTSVSSTYRFQNMGIIPPPRKHGDSNIWIVDELEAGISNCPIATADNVRPIAVGSKKGRPTGSLNKKTLAAEAQRSAAA